MLMQHLFKIGPGGIKAAAEKITHRPVLHHCSPIIKPLPNSCTKKEDMRPTLPFDSLLPEIKEADGKITPNILPRFLPFCLRRFIPDHPGEYLQILSTLTMLPHSQAQSLGQHGHGIIEQMNEKAGCLRRKKFCPLPGQNDFVFLQGSDSIVQTFSLRRAEIGIYCCRGWPLCLPGGGTREGRTQGFAPTVSGKGSKWIRDVGGGNVVGATGRSPLLKPRTQVKSYKVSVAGMGKAKCLCSTCSRSVQEGLRLRRKR